MVSALMGVTACGVPADSTDRPLRKDQVAFDPLPETTTTSTTTTTSPPPSTTTTTAVPAPTTSALPTTTVTAAPSFPFSLYFLRADGLVRVRRFMPTEPRLDDVVKAFVDGPTREEVDNGLRSALTFPSMIVGVTREGITAQVDLDASFLDLPGSEQIRALGQIVYTVTGVGAGIGNARFTFNGRRGAVPRGDGQPTTKPVARDDYASLLSSAGDEPVTTAQVPSTVPGIDAQPPT